jgi:membrane-bound lytic murein transglycosylase A
VRWPRYPAILFLFIVVPVAAGLVWWLTRPPVAGPLKLTPTSFEDLPGWKAADLRDVLAAFRRSCDVLMRQPPSAPMGTYAGKAIDWRKPCLDARTVGSLKDDARGFFEQNFAPREVSAGEARDGLFTGYYEPQLRGSRTKHGSYQTPIYGLPTDLVSVDLGLFRDALAGEHIAGRVTGHRLAPYDTRAQIDANGLKTARVLFYADDPVAAFFLHIQGSGRVVFDDGAVARVAYAGTNGRTYTAIGRTLVAQGALERGKVSLQTIRTWLRAHPDRARTVMESDASFVFFKEAPLGDPALGSPGAEQVPLTPGASIAVDSRIHPLGAPFYIATTTPDGKPLNALTIAQDIGGAIRGPVRSDIFFGFGNQAETLAGEMKQSGRMYVLIPKSVKDL